MKASCFIKNIDRISSSECGTPARQELLKDSLEYAMLPRLHADILNLANGVSVYHCFFRLFGISSNSAIDLSSWNDIRTWKFSWLAEACNFLCFGETAWGDQYGYNLDELKNSGPEPKVYFLDCLSMKSELICDNFEHFLCDEFIPNATEPYDVQIPTIFGQIGPLTHDTHIVYSPSPLVNGEEAISNVIKMDAVAAMIANGDLYRQITRQPITRKIQKLENYVDENHRSRLRVVWK